MALSRPALAVLGITSGFTRAHPNAVIIATADSIYRAAMKCYHPDRGEDTLPVPAGVNLTELQEARDAVRANVAACVKEIAGADRKSKEQKQAEELLTEIAFLEEMNDEWLRNAALLWEYVAAQKLGLHIRAVEMENVSAHSTLHLEGIALLIIEKKEAFEYICHKGAWFKRPMARQSYSKGKPYPPGVPDELIFVSSSTDKDRGYFYDQGGPHELLEGFGVLGSFMKADLARARRALKKAENQSSETGSLLGASFGIDEKILDSCIVSVLRPYVVRGAVLQIVLCGTDGSARYQQVGTVAGIRTFDQKQRP